MILKIHVSSVELPNLWAKVIHAHRVHMGSSTIVRYFASQKFRVTLQPKIK